MVILLVYGKQEDPATLILLARRRPLESPWLLQRTIMPSRISVEAFAALSYLN
jgi:hypothetical protein